MVKHKLVSSATVVALFTLATLRIKLLRMLYTEKNYVILAARLQKRSYFVKSFVLDTRAGVFIWEKVYPGYRDLGRKNRDLSNRASPTSHINTTKF